METEPEKPADTKTPWYDKLFRRQKKAEEQNDGRQPKPRLWFSSKVPFEHEVIAYSQLHPLLKDHVDEIRDMVSASRWGAAMWAAIFTAGPPFGVGMLVAGLLKSEKEVLKKRERHERLYGQKTPKANPFIDGWDKGAPNSEPRGLRALSLVFPYISLIPQTRTEKLGEVIRELAENRESPFGRTDTSELLRKYHYGIIDNAGNIILMKHPFDETAKPLNGWEKFIKWVQWHHPFQRTRFELQKPKIREKERYREMRLKPATVSTQLRLAPVRARP